ncbi:unnamed protein product [marine sediment metagenome]|uniref:Uncharacterized protein n=1 Tax=marine sediment metagenome TaxID=412755 RepID=X1C2D8_9ZZZZ
MPRIEEMYAFIVEDSGPDDEGVMAMQTGLGDDGQSLWLPLVGADMARVNSLRSIAQGIGRQIGKKVTLVHFTNREDLEVID